MPCYFYLIRFVFITAGMYFINSAQTCSIPDGYNRSFLYSRLWERSVLLILSEEEVAGKAVAGIATAQARANVVLRVTKLQEALDSSLVQKVLVVVAKELAAEALVVEVLALGGLRAPLAEHPRARSLVAAVLEVPGGVWSEIVHRALGLGVRA